METFPNAYRKLFTAFFINFIQKIFSIRLTPHIFIKHLIYKIRKHRLCKHVNGFLTYETDAFSFKAEALYNFGENFGFDDDDEVFYLWDFYSAASVSFKLAEKLTASLTGKVMIDLKKNADFAALIEKDEKAANVYAAAFALDFDINERNTVGAEFDIDTFDGNWAVAVPVYWEYHF